MTERVYAGPPVKVSDDGVRRSSLCVWLRGHADPCTPELGKRASELDAVFNIMCTDGCMYVVCLGKSWNQIHGDPRV